MIELVSFNRKIKQGFLQAAYMTNNFEILVNKIDLGIALDQHEHLENQFVYCFEGVFDLFIQGQEDNVRRMKPGCSLTMVSHAEHSARAISDFISLDFKYIDNAVKQDNSQTQNLEKSLRRNYYVDELDLGTYIITRVEERLQDQPVRLRLEPEKSTFLICSKNMDVIMAESEYQLKPFLIYQIRKEEEMFSHMSDDSEFLILEVASNE